MARFDESPPAMPQIPPDDIDPILQRPRRVRPVFIICIGLVVASTVGIAVAIERNSDRGEAPGAGGLVAPRVP